MSVSVGKSVVVSHPRVLSVLDMDVLKIGSVKGPKLQQRCIFIHPPLDHLGRGPGQFLIQLRIPKTRKVLEIAKKRALG